MKVLQEPSARVDIYMAGDIEAAKHLCRKFCFDAGLCVHVERVDYIYTGGEETGFKVGLINYPRFPSDTAALVAVAHKLTAALMEALFQTSASVVGPDSTTWFSRRKEDL